jgi:hypothetical protein
MRLSQMLPSLRQTIPAKVPATEEEPGVIFGHKAEALWNDHQGEGDLSSERRRVLERCVNEQS